MQEPLRSLELLLCWMDLATAIQTGLRCNGRFQLLISGQACIWHIYFQEESRRFILQISRLREPKHFLRIFLMWFIQIHLMTLEEPFLINILDSLIPRITLYVNVCMKAAQYILDALFQEGIEYFFMVPGKMINAFMSCFNLEEQERISPVVAAFVLDGPGIANTIGGVANAYADRYPVMLISGQIPKYYEMMGALQDSTQSGLDLAAVLKPITHTSYHIRHVENLPRYFKATVKSMYGHHKGPSHFSVAKDVLLEEVNSTYRPIDPGIVGNRIFDLHAARSFSENVIKKRVVWPF